MWPSDLLFNGFIKDKVNTKMNDTLKLLLNYSKNPYNGYDWTAIAKLLEPLYAKDMPVTAVLQIVSGAYYTIITDCRFQTPSGATELASLLKAPISGYNAIPGVLNTAIVVSISGFYNAMLAHMFNTIGSANVGWLEDDLRKYILGIK